MVPNSGLRSRSGSHDVGLALEVPLCACRDLTAKNKNFEYLRCGLAVIVTANKGQIEVMEQCPRAGWVIVPDDVVNLLTVMQGCLDNPKRLRVAQVVASDAAAGPWALERSELFYNPRLLCERLAVTSLRQRRLAKLRKTMAVNLVCGHIDSLEFIEIAKPLDINSTYDIRANIGTWALLAKSLIPSARIDGFEPLPSH
jgi:hypothetical protein